MTYGNHKSNEMTSCSKLSKLMEENRSLRMTLRMEESRRKAVFNMMQEYLGNVRVYCRCRTITHSIQCVQIHSLDTLSLYVGNKNNIEHYKFERVFDGCSSQAEVYTELMPSVCSFLDGYNVCFLTYGGEASGKTYTLLGPEDRSTENQGIAQRALHTILRERDIRQPEWNFQLLVTVIEVYNDTVTDLLSMHTGTPVRIDMSLEQIKEKLETIAIENDSHVEGLLNICRQRRKTCSTALNPHSSRSHLLIFVHLRACSRIHESEVSSVLALCDLAGFEDIIKAETSSDKISTKEAGYINKSLTALNRVFTALRTQDPNSISYRDSKLTHILKPFFTQSGKCILIVTIRTDKSSISSTQNTLRFSKISRGVNLGRPNKKFNLDKLIDSLRNA
uniref:Kinesin motor domain-containing protein n=1 Tax=Trichobilharzia regenti TaxID=157069 RepID=A0AA85JDB0_TRIRE|nr:unnamed protein product [Trichobilharzia regenti]